MTSFHAYYDTVILGAGLGGLVAGGILGRAGRKVLVLEEKSHPGGVSGMAHPEGFSFPRSPVLLLGFEQDGYADRLLSELGVSLTLLKRPGSVLKRPSPVLQVISERFRVNIETTRTEQLSEYKREWGESLPAFHKYYEALDRVEPRLTSHFLTRHPGASGGSLPKRLLHLYRLLAVKRMSKKRGTEGGKRYLERFSLPPEFQRLMDLVSRVSLGADLEGVSALDLTLLLILLSREVYRPVGGIMKLCEAVAGSCQNARCEVRFHQGIISIQRQSRKQWRICLMNGEEIECPRLIVNYPLDWIAGPKKNPARYFFKIDPRVIPLPMADQLILHRISPDEPASAVPLLLSLSLPEEETSYKDKKRLLCVTPIGSQEPPQNSAEPRVLLHRIIKNLQWLMPFSEGSIQYIGTDESDCQNDLKRLAPAADFLGKLRRLQRPHYEYAYQPFDPRIFAIPDNAGGSVIQTSEIRSAEEVATRLLRSGR